VSPVLKSILTVNLEGFAGVLEKGDITVKFVSRQNSSYYKMVNVIEVGDNTS
jgi:hypothetical protein